MFNPPDFHSQRASRRRPPWSASNALQVTQHSFRWRADDGSESAATWLAAVNTDITRATSLNTRLRVLIDTQNDAPSARYRLEYRRTTDAHWKVLR